MQETITKEKEVKKIDKPIKKTVKKKVVMVEGEFKNWETKGAPLTFSYSDDDTPSKKYTFCEGKRYKIPLAVAKHINRCGYPVSKHEVDEAGNYIGKTEEWVKRFSFRRIDDLLD